jgi:glycosyltransferase involved in cell wall biosynthesis
MTKNSSDHKGIRLLHIVGASKFGGEAFVVRHIADMAESLGWQVAVLATDPAAQAFYDTHGIPVVPLDAVRRPINPYRDLQGLWEVFRYLRCCRYDMVHTHTSKGGIIGRLAARWARVPVIVHTVHGFAFHEESTRGQVTVYAQAERLAARCCDRVVTVSHFHREWALKLGIGDADKIVAIPNGITSEYLTPRCDPQNTRKTWGVGPDELAIVSVGRLAEQKGLAYLIRTVPLLRQHLGARFRIILAGVGESEASLKSLVREVNGENHVLFLGFRQDVGDILAAADIVAIPSLWEGMSISLLEAMAARRPIVTTSIGSNLEVTKNGECALLVPPKNPDALSHAILSLAKSKAMRESLAATGERVFKEEYTAERMAERYRDVYLELLSQKGMLEGEHNNAAASRCVRSL